MTEESAKRRPRRAASRRGKKRQKAPGFFTRLPMIGKAVRQRPLVSAIVGICLLGLGVWGIVILCTAPETGPMAGNRAPGFTLETADGESITLSDFQGKMVMLSFWGPLDDSRHGDKPGQLPYFMQAVQDEWPDDKLAILNITAGADRSEVEEFINTYRLTSPVLLDSAEVTVNYDIMHYPVHFFIDSKGIIKLVLHGHFNSQGEIEDILNRIKGNKEIESLAPTISNVSVLPTDKTAVITWTTDEPATSDVIVHGLHEGELGFCMLTQPDEDLVTDHSVTVRGLASDTTCQFQVLSGYNLRNPTPSRTYSFTTLTDMSAPTIYDIDVLDITESSAIISWKTDELATSQVAYWTTDRLDSITVPDDDLTTDHSISLGGLKPGTDYHVEVRATDAIGHAAEFEILLTTASPLPSRPEVGSRAPDFTLETIDGETLALSDSQSRIVMVIFWQSGCKACKSEMPHIQAVFERWSDEELAIFAINVRESADEVKSFVESRGLTFPILLDSEGVADELYEFPVFPTAFFVDAEGIIRRIEKGRFDSAEEIEGILRSLQ